MGRNRSHRTRRPSRSRRPARRASGLDVRSIHVGPTLGEGVVGASLEEVEAALRQQPEDMNWAWASKHVIPVMPRIRSYPPGFPEPVCTVVSPGVAVGFAIDVGPAFMAVSDALIRSWDVRLADVHAQSLSNLIARAASITPSEIHEGSVGEAPTRWLQSGRSIG